MIVEARAITESKAGFGRMSVELVANQSAATSVEARAPLKVLVPRQRGTSVWTYLSNFGGGLLPGDEIDFTLSVAQGARCFVGAQSSTKIYGGSNWAANCFQAEIGPSALLVYTPDVVQAFAGSRFTQKQFLQLSDATSNLVFFDWYSAGRSARGERWKFAEYRSRTEIRIGNRLVFLDSVCLAGSDEALPLTRRFGRIDCAATLVLLGERVKESALESLEEVGRSGIQKRSDLLEVGGAIPNGAVFRYAGASVESVASAVRARVDFVSELLGDDPLERKW
jgi:urease accessory protein